MTPRKTAPDVRTVEALTGVGARFERIRRMTGYLVGTLDLFNDGKRAEEKDRIKHITMEPLP